MADMDVDDRMEAIMEHHNDVGARQLSQEPERITDEVFLRIGSAGAGCQLLAGVLEPLLERFQATDENVEAARPGPTSEGTHERGSVLREIIEEVLARVEDFNTLEQYIWLLKFSCGLCLLKNLPVGLSFEINKVIRSVANLDTEEYQFDPLMIHTIAKSLFQDIPLEGMNLVHVIKKLAVLNQELFCYVSMALIFAGIRNYTCPDQPPPPEMYRLHSLTDLLAQLDAFNIESQVKQQQLDIRRLFIVLKLLSCYQNVAILRHSCDSPADIKEQHRCFSEFFVFPRGQRKSYLSWLQLTRNIVQSVSGKVRQHKIADKEDFLLLIELLELDMIPQIEDDLSEEK